jgi:hypothetical protein
MITINGSLHGVIHVLQITPKKAYFYFKSYQKDEDSSFDYLYFEHLFKSMENIQRDWKKEIVFTPSEVIAKNFLCMPNAVEVYDGFQNRFFFFNFFSYNRQREVLKMFSTY